MLCVFNVFALFYFGFVKKIIKKPRIGRRGDLNVFTTE